MDLDEFNSDLTLFLKHNEPNDSNFQEHLNEILTDQRLNRASPALPQAGFPADTAHSFFNTFIDDSTTPPVFDTSPYFTSRHPVPSIGTPPQSSKRSCASSFPRLRRPSIPFTLTPYSLEHKNPDFGIRSIETADNTQDENMGEDASSITFKRSCKICTERRVKCSGPPGPCKSCMRRGYRHDMCVFLPRKKPGPKKKQFDMLLGVRGNSFSSIDFSDCVLVQFSELVVSTKVESIIRELKSLHFLESSDSFGLEFENEAYARSNILEAARIWVTVFGDYRAQISLQEFTEMMLSYHKHGEFDYGFDASSLKQLYWLCTGGIQDEEYGMGLHQFCLLFMWLGPSNLQSVMTAKQTVVSVYEIVSSTLIRGFEGFSSRQFVNKRLKSKGPKQSGTVIYLPEGKVKSLSKGRERSKTFMVRSCMIATIREIGPPEKRSRQVFHEQLVFDGSRGPGKASSDSIPFLNL